MNRQIIFDTLDLKNFFFLLHIINNPLKIVLKSTSLDRKFKTFIYFLICSRNNLTSGFNRWKAITIFPYTPTSLYLIQNYYTHNGYKVQRLFNKRFVGYYIIMQFGGQVVGVLSRHSLINNRFHSNLRLGKPWQWWMTNVITVVIIMPHILCERRFNQVSDCFKNN